MRFKKGDDPRRHRLTAEEKRRGGRNSKHNLRPFVKGEDGRRHRLTTEECAEGGRKGFDAVMNDRPEVLLWLKKKLKRRGK